MKKIVTIVFAIFSLGSFQIAGATSGACSFHGGVDCGAGASSNGSVICNDGWTDSSILFSQTNECTAYPPSTPCTAAESASLDQQYGVTQKYQAVTDLQNQLTTLDQEVLTTPTNDTQALNQNAVQALQLDSEITAANSTYQSAADEANAECQTLGATEYAKSQQEFQQQLDQEDQAAAAAQAAQSCPANSSLSGNSCSCNSGYASNGTACVTYTQRCQAQDGVNSYGDASGCYCNVGYVWNSSQITCSQIEVQSVQPSPTTITTSTEITNSPKENVIEKTSPTISSSFNPTVLGAKLISTSATPTGSPDLANHQASSSVNSISAPHAATPTQQGFFSKLFSSIKNFFSSIFK